MEDANALAAWFLLLGAFIGGIFSILSYLNNKRMGQQIYRNSELTRDLITALKSLEKSCDSSTTLLTRIVELLQETHIGNKHDHEKMAKEFELLGSAVDRISRMRETQSSSPATPYRQFTIKPGI